MAALSVAATDQVDRPWCHRRQRGLVGDKSRAVAREPHRGGGDVARGTGTAERLPVGKARPEDGFGAEATLDSPVRGASTLSP